MVKNFGGNKQKRQARKGFPTARDTKLRVVEEEGELYGCVTKMLGNGMCNVFCQDQKERLCFIRNKFRGRSKRDNTIVMGSFIIIGLRLWESTKENANGKGDLLEVYTQSQIEKLKDTVAIDWTIFNHIQNNKNVVTAKEDDEYGFKFNEVDTHTMETNIMQEVQQAQDDDEDEPSFLSGEINIDDI
jgi:translation initiation factor 1A